MGADRRLFLAVALDDETRHGLAAFVADQDVRIPGRLVPPPNWHITLRFLGRSTTIQQELVLAKLDDLVGVAPFTMRFGGLGAFPNPARATVLWLAVEDDRADLDRLAAGCEAAAVAAGYEPEERPFHPHLTLARLRPAENVTELVDEFPRFPGRLHVAEVVLYESITGRGGARYFEIDRVGLK